MAKNEKELRIKHKGDYLDSQKITAINDRLLAESYGEDQAVHRYEIREIVDDHDKKVRVMKLQPKRTYFFT